MIANVNEPLCGPQPIERVHCSANVLVNALTPQIDPATLATLIWSQRDKAFHCAMPAGRNISPNR